MTVALHLSGRSNYRNDFRELKDEDLKQRMEEKAYDDWHRVLSDRVEKSEFLLAFKKR